MTFHAHNAHFLVQAMKHMVMGDKQKEEEDLAAMRCEEEEDEEDGYFSGYAHFSIHHDMLAVIFRLVWSNVK